MTYKERLLELSKIAAEKANKVYEIEKEFNHDGFQKYSVFDYKRAYDEHSDAINEHGKIISRIVHEDILLDDDYLE